MITTENLVDEFNGLSTDTKPTDAVRNGSKFVEMDTKTVYLFDEENQEWVAQSEG